MIEVFAKRSVFALVLIFAACHSKKPQFVVGDNFSVWMPEAPTRATSTNDEGLPEKNWEVKHTGVTTAELYSVKLSCYRELLNPNDELQSNEALLALNGIKSIERRRFEIVAKETGRSVPAMFSATRETATGVVVNNAAVGRWALLNNPWSPPQRRQRRYGRTVHKLIDNFQVRW